MFPMSSFQMKTRTKQSHNNIENFRVVPATSKCLHENLPAITEISGGSKCSSPSSAASLGMLNYLFKCFMKTMQYLIWNTHASNTTTSSVAFHPQVTHNSDLIWQISDDDDDSDKRNFRQDMKTLNGMILQIKNNNKNKCDDTPSYTHNNVHRSNHAAVRCYRRQNYHMAEQMMRQHFVHANYLQTDE